MMKSTSIIRKAIYAKEGKIGVVKDLIIENGSRAQELASLSANTKGYSSPDWWVSNLEIELDETFKKELIAAKKIAPNEQAAAFTLKLTGFGSGAVTLTDRGVEIKTTKAQAGDNIGTLDALFKLANVAKPSRPL